MIGVNNQSYKHGEIRWGKACLLCCFQHDGQPLRETANAKDIKSEGTVLAANARWELILSLFLVKIYSTADFSIISENKRDCRGVPW